MKHSPLGVFIGVAETIVCDSFYFDGVFVSPIFCFVLFLDAIGEHHYTMKQVSLAQAM